MKHFVCNCDTINSAYNNTMNVTMINMFETRVNCVINVSLPVAPFTNMV